MLSKVEFVRSRGAECSSQCTVLNDVLKTTGFVIRDTSYGRNDAYNDNEPDLCLYRDDDWEGGRTVWQPEEDAETKKKAKAAATGDGEEEPGEEKDAAEGETEKGARTIAVDWALSKDKWEEEKSKMEIDGEDGESGSEEDGSGSEEGDGDTDGDEDDSHVGLNEDSDVDMSDEDGRSDDEERAKPSLPAPEAGTTLFVRNIPFEATEDELRTL